MFVENLKDYVYLAVPPKVEVSYLTNEDSVGETQVVPIFPSYDWTRSTTLAMLKDEGYRNFRLMTRLYEKGEGLTFDQAFAKLRNYLLASFVEQSDQYKPGLDAEDTKLLEFCLNNKGRANEIYISSLN